MLGGSISIKTEEGKGTIVVVVLDQKIGNTVESIETKNSKKYNSGIKSRKRVLIATDDTEMLEKEGRLFSKYDVDTIQTLAGIDVLDKINSGDAFDLIVLKDDMKPDTAYSILEKLKKLNKFNTPVVITIKKDKDFIKDHFINDGFGDVILEDNLEDEIKRISEKYL